MNGKKWKGKNTHTMRDIAKNMEKSKNDRKSTGKKNQIIQKMTQAMKSENGI